jgi:hypothetical protein
MQPLIGYLEVMPPKNRATLALDVRIRIVVVVWETRYNVLIDQEPSRQKLRLRSREGPPVSGCALSVGLCRGVVLVSGFLYVDLARWLGAAVCCGVLRLLSVKATLPPPGIKRQTKSHNHSSLTTSGQNLDLILDRIPTVH